MNFNDQAIEPYYISNFRDEGSRHILDNTHEGRVAGNSRNGYGKKTLKSNLGNIELSTPRDRHSTFEPQIIPKRSTKSA